MMNHTMPEDLVSASGEGEGSGGSPLPFELELGSIAAAPFEDVFSPCGEVEQ